MNKMNPEAKAKVVAALRSGEYKQAIGYLHPEEGCFCVWGVICDVSEIARWTPNIDGGGYRMFGHSAVPPDSVEKWAGIEWSKDDNVKINGHVMGISDHNDCEVSFEVLAKAIEEQL